MADAGLSDAEREELEALRAEKAAREQAAAEAAQRAELEALRAEQAAAKREAEAQAREAEARERGRALMEVDDDLNMPLGQKIVLAAVALIVLVFVIYAIKGL